MPLAGHKASPTLEETDQFVRLVQGFVTDWAVDAAVLQFAKQRPCGIYKQDYLADLFERYGDPDDCIEAPARPSWEFGESAGYVDNASTSTEESSLTHNGNEQENDSGKPAGKQFMDGLVKGVSLVTDQSKKKMLQGKIKELCGARRDGFPGLQPVSLEKSPDNDNLQFLSQRPYMVSWKADGMRYMIYICDENEIYAFDRDNEVFRIVGISFPHRKHPRHIVNTLVDAEMIIEHDIHVGKENFDIRFRCIKDELIAPRTEAMKVNSHLVCISVVIDEKCSESVTLSRFFPYTPGRCDIVLKWKPPSHNSIDFKLQIRRVVKEGELPQHIGYLYVQHLNEPLATMKATKKLLPYDNKIIECTFEIAGEITGFRFLISQALTDVLLLIQFGVWPGIIILCQKEFIPISLRWHLHVYLDFTWWAMAYHYTVIAWSRYAAVQWPSWFRTLPYGTSILICAFPWFFGLLQSMVEHQVKLSRINLHVFYIGPQSHYRISSSTLNTVQRQMSIETRLLIPCIINTILFVIGQQRDS
uniref:mRNA_cap_enzyme domain-containing protein n=1 Tax=Heterorhabditis bacteriophora TaxID=37862 RepID=A0A1I7XLM0_HETBA